MTDLKFPLDKSQNRRCKIGSSVETWEPSMQEYEIRILKADHTPDTVIEVIHLNDHAAIRAAKKFAQARPFEVWRGLDCIYGGDHRAPQPVPSHPRPAA